jgi:hypothetical protein
MITPTVHLNGTSREELLDQFRECYRSINDTLDIICKAAPHGRDYYPKGDMALPQAQKDHERRIKVLTEMRQEFLELYTEVEDQ